MKDERIARLSQQQKLILWELAKKDPALADTWSWFSATETISWKIAEYMDEDGDRIADREKKLEENQKLAEEKPELGKLLVMVNLVQLRSKRWKDKVLTRSHRASFSRSLSRLEDRDLVYLVNKYEYEDGKYKPYFAGHLVRTNFLVLTEEGREAVLESLEDVKGRGRFNPETKFEKVVEEDKYYREKFKEKKEELDL